jgi:Type IV secretion system pilin
MKRWLATALATLVVSASSVGLITAPAYAATAENCASSSSSFLGFPTWYKYLSPTFENGECRLDVVFPDSISKIVLAVVEILLRIGGLAAVVFVIYGGIQFILSQGDVVNNVPKTTIARHTVVNALIGLVIAMVATAIVRLVGNSLIT